MKEKIIILNVMSYTKKESNEPRTRLAFIFADDKYVVNSEKFRGRSELACYYNTNEVFDKIQTSMLNKVLTATLETRSSSYNPMRSSQIVKSIEVNGTVLNLL